MVCQPMRRWRSILRMGQCSDQYSRCRSLICSVESMARFPLSGRSRIDARTLLLARFASGGRGEAEVLPEPRLAPELSCCWQDAPGPRQSAKPVRQNALDRKLSCCWQDRAAAASDPGLAAVGGCVRRRPDCPPGAAASNRDCGSATSAAAILTNLAVFRVRGDLLAVIIGAAPSLAFRPAANGLTRAETSRAGRSCSQ